MMMMTTMMVIMMIIIIVLIKMILRLIMLIMINPRKCLDLVGSKRSLTIHQINRPSPPFVIFFILNSDDFGMRS